MSPQRHARVKEIFLRAAALPAAERSRLLDRECGDRPSLRAEVETLLQHHRSETILTTDALARDSGGLPPAPIGAAVEPSAYRSPAAQLFSQALGGPWRRWIGVLIAVAALVLLAAWTHFQIKHSLRDVAGRHLEALLNANVAALEAWVDRQRADAEAWANDPSIRECVQRLVEQEGGQSASPSPAENATPAELLDILSPYLQERGSAAVAMVDRSGRVWSSADDSESGTKRAAPDQLPWLFGERAGAASRRHL